MTDTLEPQFKETRVKCTANFSGYVHEFGITVEAGQKYELSADVVSKFNESQKVTATGKKPFTVTGKVPAPQGGSSNAPTPSAFQSGTDEEEVVVYENLDETPSEKLEALTKAEIIQFAEDNGLEVDSTANKADLIAAVVDEADEDVLSSL